jgi:site-specific DNA-methyltransferase (adenine-specific)
MAITETVARNTIHEADLFDLCGRMSDQSVDMILADLPYGTTACSWDTVIPFEPMWAAFRRIIKPRGAIVLTASQPFTSALVMSNPKWFRYSWVWAKGRGTNFQLANTMPMKAHEDVLVFGRNTTRYFPQHWKSTPYQTKAGLRGGAIEGLGSSSAALYRSLTISSGDRFPISVISINRDGDCLHPTQKPVALFEYLIRTYTQPGELVFDPTAGSGTTAVAARQTGRDYIVGDSSPEYVAIMRERLGKPYTLPMMELEQACLSANA